jgi:prophage regulatory protein
MALSNDLRFLRLPAVMDRVGLRRTKIYALIRANDFPKPRHEGKAAYWPSDEIAAWQAARLARAA